MHFSRHYNQNGETASVNSMVLVSKEYIVPVEESGVNVMRFPHYLKFLRG